MTLRLLAQSVKLCLLFAGGFLQALYLLDLARIDRTAPVYHGELAFQPQADGIAPRRGVARNASGRHRGAKLCQSVPAATQREQKGAAGAQPYSLRSPSHPNPCGDPMQAPEWCPKWDRGCSYSASGWFSGLALANAGSSRQALSTATILGKRSRGTLKRRAVDTRGTTQRCARR